MARLELGLGMGLLRLGLGIRLGMGLRLVLLDSVLGLAALLVRPVALRRCLGALCPRSLSRIRRPELACGIAHLTQRWNGIATRHHAISMPRRSRLSNFYSLISEWQIRAIHPEKFQTLFSESFKALKPDRAVSAY